MSLLFYDRIDVYPEFEEAINQLQQDIGEVVLLRCNDNVVAFPFSQVISYEKIGKEELNNPEIEVFLSLNKGLVGIPSKNSDANIDIVCHTVASIKGIRIARHTLDFTFFKNTVIRSMSGNAMGIIISQTIQIEIENKIAVGETICISDELKNDEDILVFDVESGEIIAIKNNACSNIDAEYPKAGALGSKTDN